VWQGLRFDLASSRLDESFTRSRCRTVALVWFFFFSRRFQICRLESTSRCLCVVSNLGEWHGISREARCSSVHLVCESCTKDLFQARAITTAWCWIGVAHHSSGAIITFSRLSCLTDVVAGFLRESSSMVSQVRWPTTCMSL
jgi:hypothetical protein